MSRKDQMKALAKLMDKMIPNLKAAGIGDTELSAFNKEIDTKSDEQIVAHFESLINLTLPGGAYRDFIAIYGLKPSTWWETMELLGETNLREHKLRNAASKKLRHAWRQLHHVKEKATSINDKVEGTSEGISDRS